MPRLRTGVSQWRAVRAADGGPRDTFTGQKRMTPWWQKLGYRALGHHRLLLVGSSLLAAVAACEFVPKRMGLPKLALRRGSLPVPTGNDTWLFTGCVMDAWQRQTHRSTAKVLSAVGVTYQMPGSGGACCGALHIHAGLTDEAKGLARKVMWSMPGEAPIVVNSAGCGAALKDYGHLLGTEEARAFSARVPRCQRVRRPARGSLEGAAPSRPGVTVPRA